MKSFKNIIILVVVTSAIFIGCSSDESVGDFNSLQSTNFVYFDANAVNNDTIFITKLSANQDPITLVANYATNGSNTDGFTVPITVTGNNSLYTISGTEFVFAPGEYSSELEFLTDPTAGGEAFYITLGTPSNGADLGLPGDTDNYGKVFAVNVKSCEVNTSIWEGALSILDVGYPPPYGGMGSGTGECNELIVNGDLPNGGVGAADFVFSFTPAADGATNGTVDVPAQTYCTNCSGGLDALYSASGVYDEVTGEIVVQYSLDRTDGAHFWTGVNQITLP